MTKRKLTQYEIENLLNESDSEFDSDDSLADCDWLPENAPGDESSSDDESSESDDRILFTALQPQVLDEEEDEADEAVQGSGDDCWGDFAGRQQSFPFCGQKGVQRNVSRESSPMDIYQLLINDEVINHIVLETNRYANQTITSKPPTKNSRLYKWTDTNPEEVKKFLGLVQWMGLVRLGTLESYWAKHGIYKQCIPRLIMPRNRFQALLSMIHFSNNEEIQQGDRLAKIQPLVELLQKNFQHFFTPDEDIVIDETLIPWRGRLIFRQYIPNKAHRYGVKLFKLCSVDGYTWAMKIYSGKSRTGERELGLAKNVCLELLQGLLNQGRTLYVDNFYSSYELALCLLEKQTHVVGTLRAKKKGISKEVLDAKLKRGEAISREDENGVVVLKWRDTRDVRMLTTKHAPTMVPINLPQSQTSPGPQANPMTNQPSTSATPDQPQSSNRRRRSQKTTEKPLPIIAYNKAKAGIDLSDQMASYVTTMRKGVKWYRKLGIELILGVAVVNAWVMYKRLTLNKIQIRSFREVLAAKLLQIDIASQTQRRSSDNTHLLLKRVDESGKKIRRHCNVCYAKYSKEGGRKEARRLAKMVHTYCDKCPDQPQMCQDCFNSHQK